MSSVGAFEAKTRFAQLLDRVERGEEIVITRHGKPVAVLRPVDESPDREALRRLAQELREHRERHGGTLAGLTIKELTHGGHKY
jgi:prevent-host-death family protein